MSDLLVPLSGSTLVVGPTNSGKTTLTARALEAFLAAESPEGVVVFEFGPEIHRDGALIGGRLSRFTTIPDGVFYGVLEAHAPRSEATDETTALSLARSNARRAAEIISAAPADPSAVFVNDATIAFGHPEADLSVLLDYCDSATVSVINAYSGEELGGADHPVSRAETRHLDRLRSWADRVHELG